MKKRIMTLVLSVAMIFSMCVNASATEKTPQGYEDAITMGYDDFLTDQAFTRGSNPPSATSLWNFGNGDYEGYVSRIRTGVYTNYCFYPNSNGELCVTTNLQRHIDANGNYHNWKIVVSAYNMDGKYFEETETGELHTDSLYHEDELLFTELDSNTKYCFFIKVYNEVCQVTGDVIVSR